MSNDHIKVTCVGDDHITLTHTGESKEVMRITRDGVYVADGVSVDEAAQVVLDTLSGEIQRLVSVARAVLHEQLASVKKERDELVAALDKISRVNAMDYEYQRWAKDALAKVGAENAGEKMSNALDHVRNNCGIAGEEVVDMVYELERQLADLQRERDELLKTLDKLARLGNEPHYGNSIGNQIAIDAIAKLGADKTGEV